MQELSQEQGGPGGTLGMLSKRSIQRFPFKIMGKYSEKLSHQGTVLYLRKNRISVQAGVALHLATALPSARQRCIYSSVDPVFTGLEIWCLQMAAYLVNSQTG